MMDLCKRSLSKLVPFLCLKSKIGNLWRKIKGKTCKTNDDSFPVKVFRIVFFFRDVKHPFGCDKIFVPAIFSNHQYSHLCKSLPIPSGKIENHMLIFIISFYAMDVVKICRISYSNHLKKFDDP